MNVERRALNGIVVNIFSFAFNLGQTVLIVPILIKFWGVESYGLWLTISAFMSLLQTIDNGHQNYVGNELTKFYITGAGTEKLKQTLASSIWMAGILGCLQLIILIGIIAFGFIEKILGSNSVITENQEIGVALIVLVVTWILTGSVGGILSRLYLPLGMYVRFTTWAIIAQFFKVTSILLTAILGGKLLVASIVSSLVSLIIYIFFFREVYQIFHNLYPFWTNGSWKIAFTNVCKSFFLTGVGFLSQLQNNGLTLFVSGIVGAAFIPALSTMRTLTNTFLAGTAIVTMSLIPEMTRYHTQGEHKKLVDMISTAWWSGGLLINLGLVITLPCIEPIYLHWTRGQISFNWVLYLILAWSISLKNFGNPQSIYLMGINHIKAQTTIAVVQTTIILGITSLFLAKYGLVAVGIAIVCSEIIGSGIMATIYTILELRSLGGNLLFTRIVLAFFAVVIVGLTYISVGLYWLSPLIASIVGGIILIGLYLWQWQYLSIDVRYRLIKLFYKFTSLSYKHRT
ncbi:lipopolysaccharide biosynthesis protein [Nostoc sp.]|uniref:lipopolysaccharide biosynthesis protein n=1 Tax=Nostoc sp. TaxID=1180 RepID=UPI002FF8D27A